MELTAESYFNVTSTMRLIENGSDDGWETVDDDTRDLIGGGQLERQMAGLSWRIEAIMKKVADVDGEDDDNMRNYSRGYEDDVDNRDHVRNISECHARI